MLARRIVVVCTASGLGAELTSALEIAGCVLEIVPEPSALRPEQLVDTLCVFAIDDGASPSTLLEVLARLVGDARAMIAVTQPSLPTTIEWLAASDRVVAVVGLDALEHGAVSRLAAVTLDGKPLGLEQVLGAGAGVQTHLIENERAKRECLTRLAEHLASIGVPTRLQRAIEQACDELVSNGLYAAPVGADGRPLFVELSTAERVRYQVDAPVTTRFGGNGTQFALSVRDEFGSLERETPVKFLHKGAHATDKVDRKLSGAGLGLYLLASECAAMYFHVEHGIATEIMCVFDLRAPRQQLQQFAVIAEGDPATLADRARSRNAQLRPAPTHVPLRTWILRVAVAASVAGMAAVIAWRVLRSTDDTMSLAITAEPAGATLVVDGRPIASSTSPVISRLRPGIPALVAVDHPGYVGRRIVVQPSRGQEPLSVALRQVPATLDIDSTPPGAVALIDGKPVGQTPVAVTDLPAGREVTITLQRQGFADAIVRTVVPPAGSRSEIREQLAPATGFAIVHIDSQPPGARIVDASGGLGKLPRFTPADLVLSTRDEHRLVLTMSHHLPASLPAFTADVGMSRSAVLQPVPVIQLETDRAATATIVGVAHCAAIELPGECPVSPGTYEVEIRAAGQPLVRRTATVAEQDVVIRYSR